MKPIEGLVRIEPINRLLKLQIIVLTMTGLIVFFWQGTSASSVYLYGGAIAVGNTLLQKWHLLAAANSARADANKNLGRAYRCVAERWLLTIVLFAIGFSAFAFAELLLVGFVVAQVVVLFGHYNRA